MMYLKKVTVLRPGLAWSNESAGQQDDWGEGVKHDLAQYEATGPSVSVL